MVIHEGNAARDLAPAQLLPVFDQMGADHVRNSQRPIVVAFLAAHAIKFVQEFLVERNAETGDLFHSVTVSHE